jgi:hypothetical protein
VGYGVDRSQIARDGARGAIRTIPERSDEVGVGPVTRASVGWGTHEVGLLSARELAIADGLPAPVGAGRAGSFERDDDGPHGVLPFSTEHATASGVTRDSVDEQDPGDRNISSDVSSDHGSRWAALTTPHLIVRWTVDAFGAQSLVSPDVMGNSSQVARIVPGQETCDNHDEM